MKTIEGNLTGAGYRMGIAVARFNSAIVENLLSGALDCLKRHGVDDSNITVAWVPGSFELPLVATELAETGTVDAVIALGAVIQGSTDHYRYVAGEAAKGLLNASMATRVPVIFGVLTTENIEQAIERAGTKAGNKGWDAAMSAIETVSVVRSVRRIVKDS